MSMTRLTAWLPACIERGALLLAAAGVLALTACGGGSGAPNNPYAPGPSIPGPLTVIPAEAIAYPGTPLILSISGGTPPYQAFSANPAVLPVPQNVSGNTLVLAANNVDTPQNANITIRDAAGQTATAEITVRPALLLPTSVTVTGNPSCSGSGGTLCSGQNGTASVLVTGPGSGGLAGRQVRFDVVQGDFALTSTNPGQPLVSTLMVVSDQNGFAVVTLQVPSTALTQVATIRATDVASGNMINSNFTIVAFKDGSAVLSVSPTAVTVAGLPASPPRCAVNVPVTYYVYGGTPPYTVAANMPTLVTITGVPINQSGGGFTALPNNCVDEIFTITDASGRFINATLSSTLGPDSGGGGGGGGGGTGGACSSFSPPNPACPTITPAALNLTACTGTGSSASATLSGGTPPFTTSAPTGVTASIVGNTLTVTRVVGTTVTSPLIVRVNAGSLFQDVTVNITPAACP
jgi:hypothetical protein